ncbi:hypothetical protein ACUNDQ_10585 [Pectobacterium brasiliense]|uniref:hypothetical protein n=1 Tax=Pectobacterium brasiliense TaxID=180957 RepID=UPI004044C1FB
MRSTPSPPSLPFCGRSFRRRQLPYLRALVLHPVREATASMLSVYALMRVYTLIASDWRNRPWPFAASANASMSQRRHFIRRKAVASDAANDLCASPCATVLSGMTCHLTHIFCANSH